MSEWITCPVDSSDNNSSDDILRFSGGDIVKGMNVKGMKSTGENQKWRKTGFSRTRTTHSLTHSLPFYFLLFPYAQTDFCFQLSDVVDGSWKIEDRAPISHLPSSNSHLRYPISAFPLRPAGFLLSTFYFLLYCLRRSIPAQHPEGAQGKGQQQQRARDHRARLGHHRQHHPVNDRRFWRICPGPGLDIV